MLVATTAALGACGGDDSFSPTPATVQGTYNASRFTATNESVGTVNLLALGAEVHVVLNADGTTTGHLSVPDLGPGAVEADLAGTWSLSGTTVTFSPTAQLVIGDTEFTAAPEQSGRGRYLRGQHPASRAFQDRLT